MNPPKQKSLKNPLPKKQSFLEHLKELRLRLLWCFVFLFIGSGIGYSLHQQILTILVRPLQQTLFFTSPAGGFDFIFTISLFFGLIVSTPVFVYHTIRFIEPALPKKLPYFLFRVLVASTLLLIIGMTFAYFVSLPAALAFLNRFATSQVQSLITTNEYFTFISRYLVGFGLIFQLPLIMIAVNAMQEIPIRLLLGYERWVIILSFLLAAIITPTPDPINQFIMAAPIIFLYQFTVILIWFLNRKT
jgi:sec-independent protein translocase protein TatC